MTYTTQIIVACLNVLGERNVGAGDVGGIPLLPQ